MITSKSTYHVVIVFNLVLVLFHMFAFTFLSILIFHIFVNHIGGIHQVMYQHALLARALLDYQSCIDAAQECLGANPLKQDFLCKHIKNVCAKEDDAKARWKYFSHLYDIVGLSSCTHIMFIINSIRSSQNARRERDAAKEAAKKDGKSLENDRAEMGNSRGGRRGRQY